MISSMISSIAIVWFDFEAPFSQLIKGQWYSINTLLTQSFPMHPFCTPENIRKSEGRERVHWERMD